VRRIGSLAAAVFYFSPRVQQFQKNEMRIKNYGGITMDLAV
jgi:hypothetical protein